MNARGCPYACGCRPPECGSSQRKGACCTKRSSQNAQSWLRTSGCGTAGYFNVSSPDIDSSGSKWKCEGRPVGRRACLNACTALVSIESVMSYSLDTHIGMSYINSGRSPDRIHGSTPVHQIEGIHEHQATISSKCRDMSSRNHLCDICGQVFVRAEHLSRHRRIRR